MKISVWSVGCLALATSGLFAQQSTLTGPVAGFVFDGPGRVVRPIQGVPGASLLGDPVNFGFDLTDVFISPTQDSAFVVAADSSLHFFRMNGSGVTEVSLGGLSGPPQAVVFSPSGTSAALLALGKARVLTGLSGTPLLAATVNVPSSVQPVEPTRGIGRKVPNMTTAQGLALSDDGGYLLTVSGGSARLLGNHGENRILTPAQAGALVAFAAGGHDVALMDSVTGLTLIRDASGTGSPQVLAAPDDTLAGPAGLAFSRDGQTLYVASATAQSVAAFNLAGGSRSTIGCACTPSTLAPMGNVFRLNDVSPSPLWILDTGSSTPRTVFVPARGE